RSGSGGTGAPAPVLPALRLHVRKGGIRMDGIFGGDSWLWIIVVGLVVGLLARLLKPGRDRMGLVLTTLLGIGGALLAGWVGRTMGWYAPGQQVGFLASLVGAIVILLVVGKLRRCIWKAARGRGGTPRGTLRAVRVARVARVVRFGRVARVAAEAAPTRERGNARPV